MEKVSSDGGWLELNITNDGIEMLRNGKSVSTKWGPGQAYLSDLERHLKRSKDKVKHDHAVLDAETMRLDIYISWESIANQCYNSKIFSKKLNNLSIEPAPDSAEKEYGDMRIKLNFKK